MLKVGENLVGLKEIITITKGVGVKEEILIKGGGKEIMRIIIKVVGVKVQIIITKGVGAKEAIPIKDGDKEEIIPIKVGDKALVRETITKVGVRVQTLTIIKVAGVKEPTTITAIKDGDKEIIKVVTKVGAILAKLTIIIKLAKKRVTFIKTKTTSYLQLLNQQKV